MIFCDIEASEVDSGWSVGSDSLKRERHVTKRAMHAVLSRNKTAMSTQAETVRHNTM